MEWEHIVNQHSSAKKHNEHYARKKKYLHRLCVSAIISIAFILATGFNLVHVALGVAGMVVPLMISFYYFGRAVECGRNDF